MRAVFRDASIQKKFDKEGYVYLPSFLENEEIPHLAKTLNSLNTEIKEGFHVTNWSPNSVYRTLSNREIVNALGKKAGALLNDYKPALGAYAVKMPGQGSEMGLHQDWSLVDEALYTSVSFWVPLVDVDETNGILQIFTGSHNIFHNYRGQNIQVPFHNNDVQNLIKENYLDNIPVKAGDALVLHHRLVHMSGPNYSQHTRAVAMLAMVPSESKIRHYYKSPDANAQVEVFECEDDFYLHFNITERPFNQKVVSVMDYREDVITKEDLKKEVMRRNGLKSFFGF